MLCNTVRNFGAQREAQLAVLSDTSVLLVLKAELIV